VLPGAFLKKNDEAIAGVEGRPIDAGWFNVYHRAKMKTSPDCAIVRTSKS